MQAPLEFDGCEIVEQLSMGPVADVYHAIQKSLGRPVLVKALSPSILPSSPFAATLEREARLLAELDHRNVLKLHDYVRKDERMWLVLEYVDGVTLAEVLRRAGKLAPAAAAAVALQVARALEHAHEHGIIHRDIEPKNIIISRRGEVKVDNFTVAVDERLPTAPELLDGSTGYSGPVYMSPEQILGEPADPRSDLFSLGVVLYEMLSGARPFASPDERSATQRIRHDQPAPLARVVPGIGSLERVVHRCLEKLPVDRFASANELKHALERSLVELGAGAPETVLATALLPTGLSEPPRTAVTDAPPPPSRRKRGTSLGAALAGLCVCSVLLVGGGAVIRRVTILPDSTARRTGGTLELVPRRTAYLRVVADPWAHVYVDGQLVDTTPFSRPIPLSAGTHYVRLEHPAAPPERRTVELSNGETLLLDVKLDVRAPARTTTRVSKPASEPITP